MIGRVVSVKMQKTAVVLVETPKIHPLYNKRFLRTKKYLVDDPIGVKLGQIVNFEKIRPISKMKHWQIKKVLGLDVVALGTEALKEEAKEAIAEVLPEEVVETPVEEVATEAEVKTEKPKRTRAKKEKAEGETK
jgi:small subunit ribosomal protein S17